MDRTKLNERIMATALEIVHAITERAAFGVNDLSDSAAEVELGELLRIKRLANFDEDALEGTLYD